MIKKIIKYVSFFFLLFLNIILNFNIKNYLNILEKCFNRNIIIDTKYHVIISIILALISILIYIGTLLITFRNKTLQNGIKINSEDGSHGTADWMNDKEAEQVLGLNNEPGIILGKKNGKPVVLPFKSYFNKNILVLGSPGSMKSVAFILLNILQLCEYGKSMIISDSKGDLYKKTAYLLRKKGYTVKVFNLCDMAHSDRWNPLAEIENINDAQNTADIIISNTQKHNKNSDDFWPRAEENLLKAFILYFKEKMIETNTLTDIYLKIAGRDISDIDNMFSSLPKDSAARMSYNIFAQGSDTIKSSVLTGLGTRLQAFQNELVQNVTAESDIDLKLPAKEKCAYFVITSDMDGGTYEFLSSLFYTFLFIKLIRYADNQPSGTCDNEVFMLLDEFCNIGTIPEFPKKISTARSRMIGIWPVIQNIAQIENRFPGNSWQEILGDCDTKLSLSCTDLMSAKYVSELLGISTAESMSIRKEAGIEGELQYGQKNITTIQRNLLTADEVMRLPYYILIVFLKANKPYLIEKMIYTEHPLAKGLKDTPINEYIPEWQKVKKEIKNEIKIKKKKKPSFKNF